MTYEEVKINYDGSSLGNPSTGGTGSTFIAHNRDFLGVLMVNIGVTTSYYAECSSILYALYTALDNNWLKVFLVSDSKAAISAFINKKIPWDLRARWEYISSKLQIRFKHS
ncbi:hypothetical protein GIB67_032450 [Kingdonia uniflora]|uniref:RNase H type-1 domain-containing protein n=1 Tax=Kingdonia uniflora TaxID=39325 RepID=A0A7J7L7D9_9MAGN|nr:hypothetical protein GIB67_032450 [Kingdonia uniflora]